MRILLYGMQSSGASLIAFFLGQSPRAVAVVDLWNQYLAPDLETRDADPVIVKCVVADSFSLEDHRRSFGPDRTVLVLRHPVHNYVSLSRKEYSEQSGSIDDKFRLLERSFREREQFDVAIMYEEFVRDPGGTVRRLRAAQIPAEESFYDFPRTQEEILRFNAEQSDWCERFYEVRWGFGNVRGDAVKQAIVFKHATPVIQQKVRELCPELLDYFDAYYREKIPRGRRRLNALLHDVVLRPFRRK